MSREPRRHPPAGELLAHATGRLDAGARVLVEAHLAFCSSCREELADLAVPGGLWLEESRPEAPPPAVFERVLERVRDLPPDPVAEIPLPGSARAELAAALAPRWRRVPLSSARFAVVWRERATQTALLAVVLGGDRTLPRHLHLGPESGVVLQGSYRDPKGRFGLGDYFENGAGTEHGPRTGPEEPCWIVARIEQGIRFRGLPGVVQALQQRLRRRSRPSRLKT